MYIETHVTYSFAITMIRMVNNVFIPSTFNITAHLSRGENSNDSKIEFGLSKIKYWFNNIVSKAIAFNKDNELAFEILLDTNGSSQIHNVFLLCPDEPCDEILGSLFQAKMNAFANGAFTVECIDINSDNLDGLSFTLEGDHGAILPQTMEEWLEDESYFDVPWWKRDDASTLDVFLHEDADPAIRPPWALKLDFLDNSKAELEKPAFRPKIIAGGKDED